jgi:hypothetical protein
MTDVIYAIAVAITLAIGLHLSVVSGYAASAAADRDKRYGRHDEMLALVSRSLGIASGIAGVAFGIRVLTLLGIALVALYAVMTARRLAMIPAQLELPLIVLSFMAAIPIVLLRKFGGI